MQIRSISVITKQTIRLFFTATPLQSSRGFWGEGDESNRFFIISVLNIKSNNNLGGGEFLLGGWRYSKINISLGGLREATL